MSLNELRCRSLSLTGLGCRNLNDVVRLWMQVSEYLNVDDFVLQGLGCNKSWLILSAMSDLGCKMLTARSSRQDFHCKAWARLAPSLSPASPASCASCASPLPPPCLPVPPPCTSLSHPSLDPLPLGPLPLIHIFKSRGNHDTNIVSSL